MSRMQRILPQRTYRHEIALVKDDVIELCAICRISYCSRVKKGLWHQQEWSGTYPPQIHHVQDAKNLAAVNLPSWDCIYGQGWWHWTLCHMSYQLSQQGQKMSLTPTRMIRNLSSKDPSCPERKESCRSELTVMRLRLQSRMTASNFAPNAV